MEVLLQPFKKAWSHFGGNHGFWGLRPAGLCTNATNAVNATPFQKSFDEDYPEVFSSVLFTIASCERPCHTTTELEAEYGDFGDMAIDLLRGDHCETWTKFNVCDGAFPTERELSSFQGLAITGSRHDAHGNETWITELRELVKNEAGRGQIILGICFGAQLLAHSLGGKSGRAAGGWVCGTRSMQLEPAWFQQTFTRFLPSGWQINLHQTHRDQILELPAGAVLLASSPETPYEIWTLGSNVLAIQGHPEFSVTFQNVLNDYRVANGSMSPEEKVQAETDMREHPVDAENARVLAQVLQAFLKRRS